MITARPAAFSNQRSLLTKPFYDSEVLIKRFLNSSIKCNQGLIKTQHRLAAQDPYLGSDGIEFNCLKLMQGWCWVLMVPAVTWKWHPWNPQLGQQKCKGVRHTSLPMPSSEQEAFPSWCRERCCLWSNRARKRSVTTLHCIEDPTSPYYLPGLWVNKNLSDEYLQTSFKVDCVSSFPIHTNRAHIIARHTKL